MKLKEILKILLVLYCNCKKATTDRLTWSDMTNVLKEESNGNKVLFLHEHKFINKEISHFLKEIVRRLPTRIADFENVTEAHKQKIPLPEDHLETTTLVVISSENDYGNSSNLSKLMSSIAKLANPKPHPKVLILTQVTNATKYENFFKFLWSEQFLDVSILELQLQDGCEVMFRECSLAEINLHYYNPFTKRSYKSAFVENSRLFPNKLLDLNGYKIHVSFFDYQPYVYVKRNSTRHPIGIDGTDANLAYAYSDKMNFTLVKNISHRSNWIKIVCDEKYFWKIFKGLDYIGVQSGLAHTCWDAFYYTSQGTRMINFAMLVPTLTDEMKVITEWNFGNVANIISLISMPWLLSRFLKFERRYWKFMYTIAMVINFSTPEEPKRKVERLIFLLLWVFYFLQSSFIFTTLSSFQMQKITFKKMETFDDIVAANLTVILHGNAISSNDLTEKLMKTAKYSSQPFGKCTEMLMKYQNVSCIGRKDFGLLSIKANENKYNESRVEIFKGYSSIRPSVLYHMGGSPYKSRFEFITSVLIESGISDMWDASYIPKESSLQNQADVFKDESLLSSNAFFLMIYCFLVGCLVSFFAFAGEIIIHKYLKKIKGMFDTVSENL